MLKHLLLFGLLAIPGTFFSQTILFEETWNNNHLTCELTKENSTLNYSVYLVRDEDKELVWSKTKRTPIYFEAVKKNGDFIGMLYFENYSLRYHLLENDCENWKTVNIDHIGHILYSVAQPEYDCYTLINECVVLYNRITDNIPPVTLQGKVFIYSKTGEKTIF